MKPRSATPHPAILRVVMNSNRYSQLAGGQHSGRSGPPCLLRFLALTRSRPSSRSGGYMNHHQPLGNTAARFQRSSPASSFVPVVHIRTDCGVC